METRALRLLTIGGGALHFLLEIADEPAAADALRTLVLGAGEKFSDVITGKGPDGRRMEGP